MIVSEWKENVTSRWHVMNHVGRLHSNCMYVHLCMCNSDIVSVIYANAFI